MVLKVEPEIMKKKISKIKNKLFDKWLRFETKHKRITGLLYIITGLFIVITLFWLMASVVIKILNFFGVEICIKI